VKARENVQGIVDENALHRFEYIHERPGHSSHVVVLIDRGWSGGAAARIVLRLGWMGGSGGMPLS